MGLAAREGVPEYSQQLAVVTIFSMPRVHAAGKEMDLSTNDTEVARASVSITVGCPSDSVSCTEYLVLWR